MAAPLPGLPDPNTEPHCHRCYHHPHRARRCPVETSTGLCGCTSIFSNTFSTRRPVTIEGSPSRADLKSGNLATTYGVGDYSPSVLDAEHLSATGMRRRRRTYPPPEIDTLNGDQIRRELLARLYGKESEEVAALKGEIDRLRALTKNALQPKVPSIMVEGRGRRRIAELGGMSLVGWVLTDDRNSPDREAFMPDGVDEVFMLDTTMWRFRRFRQKPVVDNPDES